MKIFSTNQVILIGLLAACSACAKSTSSSGSNDNQCCNERPATTNLKTEVIASGLDRPWGMAFLQDGSMLVTERTGNLRRIDQGQVSEPFSGLPEIAVVGQGGLLDIALDPDFDQNSRVYISYVEPSAEGNEQGTAVARAVVDLTARQLLNLEVVFTSNIKSSGGRHFGSRLRFASDKTLFVTLGDRGDQPRAQDRFDHAGSVIRINADGSVPADNPFADGRDALPEIWSIGHRNAQGAAIHPETDQLWTLSHGAAGGDEVNRPEAGKNYGWPLISYGSNYSGSGFEKGTAADGLEQPVYFWDPSIAPSGLTFYNPENALIPSWKGSLLAGALAFQHLSRLVMDGDSVIAEERYLDHEFGRIRDVRTGPDGAVWILTDSSNGQLIRITEAGN